MRQSIVQPKVSLVGAGPGDKDLITVKGLKTLQLANVVLYDALIDVSLLDEVAESVPKIFVGKRCGLHSLTQDEINMKLVENAFTYGHVVRLKGGDPFVFGRAPEEIAYVESFGIHVDMVPGISSVTAVPGNQGIPLTKRGTSSSFWVVTGTTQSGGLNEDLIHAAKSSATLVILMGVRKIREIAEQVQKYRGGLTPIALIQNGTMPSEVFEVATLNTVKSILSSVDISNPGIIVIGEVVAEHPAFFEEDIQRVISSHL